MVHLMYVIVPLHLQTAHYVGHAPVFHSRLPLFDIPFGKKCDAIKFP